MAKRGPTFVPDCVGVVTVRMSHSHSWEVGLTAVAFLTRPYMMGNCPQETEALLQRVNGKTFWGEASTEL